MEAIISSAETDTLLGEAELKRQELSDAKLLVEDATLQLKSEGFKFHPISYLNLVFHVLTHTLLLRSFGTH